MLDNSLQYIKGIGPKRAKILSRLGINDIRDALQYFPREYSDRRNVTKIAKTVHGEKLVINGKVEIADVMPLGPKLSVFKAAVKDETGIIFAVFFRQFNRYFSHDVFSKLKKDFAKDSEVLLYGAVENNFGEKQIKVEEYEVINEKNSSLDSPHFNRIIPVYPITEGFSQKWFREFMFTTVNGLVKEWPEVSPANISKEYKLGSAAEALRKIHFPDEFEQIEESRKRLAFDEFLLFETALALVKKKNIDNIKPRKYSVKKELLTPFKNKLTFEFTNSQKKVINEIFSDMQSNKPMNRMLMGDVGSGKTVVALSAVLLAIENGYQAAILAPTEILAEQHFITIQNMLSGLPVKMCLLTGKLSQAKTKKAIKDEIACGETSLIIGTHAILEENVKFMNLGIIIIDEQHRFGVMQRAKIQEKAKYPDVLVMTATPIPRTLALTLYGDLDVSVIDEMPPHRLPIQTLFVKDFQAYKSAKEEVAKGRQVYIVYPLVEESDKIELKAAVTEANYLSKTVFKDYKLDIIHGQMPSKDKERVMTDFRDKKFDILIATTVIEVGIDVPNATLIIIEHSERFGLATLHQLRGRVGRGKEKSFCLLLGNPKTEEAKKRISVMTKNNNGFLIAEEDLSMRGPGEFFGTMQHGMPQFKAGNLITDIKIIEDTRKIAENILFDDPKLANNSNKNLKLELIRQYKDKLAFSNIS
jgi:ATP-dependent DNA helicase RecG